MKSLRVPGEHSSRVALALAMLFVFAALAVPASDAAKTKPKREPIVLLDLNYTFVENQAETAKLGGEDFGRRLEFERYRRWLLDLVRDGHVILITARPVKYRERTLARIDSLLGWKPDEVYFNEHDLMPAVCKQEVLLTKIFPRYGKPSDGTRYYAVESNPRTALMYAGFGIPALRVWDDWQYVDSTRASK